VAVADRGEAGKAAATMASRHRKAPGVEAVAVATLAAIAAAGAVDPRAAVRSVRTAHSPISTH
jgi:hypothetical protein